MEVRLSAVRIPLTGLTTIIGGWRSLRTLATIHLDSCAIGNAGVTLLSPAALRVSGASLLHLAITRDTVSDSGARAIAPLCGAASELSSLNLDNNRIGDDGGAAIASALGSARAIETVSICGNRIGPAAAAEIAGAIYFNEGLRTIALAHNRIGAEGALAFAEIVPKCASKKGGTLRLVDLTGNAVGAYAAASLQLASQTKRGVVAILAGGGGHGCDCRSCQSAKRAIGGNGVNAIDDTDLANAVRARVALEDLPPPPIGHHLRGAAPSSAPVPPPHIVEEETAMRRGADTDDNNVTFSDEDSIEENIAPRGQPVDSGPVRLMESMGRALGVESIERAGRNRPEDMQGGAAVKRALERSRVRREEDERMRAALVHEDIAEYVDGEDFTGDY